MESEEATRSQVAVLNAQIESLTVKVEGKDRELVDLERQLQELKDRNTALENQLSEYMAAMQEQSKVVLSFNFMYCTCTCTVYVYMYTSIPCIKMCRVHVCIPDVHEYTL